MCLSDLSLTSCRKLGLNVARILSWRRKQYECLLCVPCQLFKLAGCVTLSSVTSAASFGAGHAIKYNPQAASKTTTITVVVVTEAKATEASGWTSFKFSEAFGHQIKRVADCLLIRVEFEFVGIQTSFDRAFKVAVDAIRVVACKIAAALWQKLALLSHLCRQMTCCF